MLGFCVLPQEQRLFVRTRDGLWQDLNCIARYIQVTERSGGKFMIGNVSLLTAYPPTLYIIIGKNDLRRLPLFKSLQPLSTFFKNGRSGEL